MGFFGRPSGIATIILSLSIVISGCAEAQGTGAEQGQQSQPPATNGKPVEHPPSPVYSKHHHGMYKNQLNLWVIDASPQSPPLEVDDPGVPDKGQYEINLTTHADFSRQLKAFDFVLVDANYGVLPKVFGHDLPTQVKFEFPLAGAKKKASHSKSALEPPSSALNLIFITTSTGACQFRSTRKLNLWFEAPTLWRKIWRRLVKH